MTTATPPRRRTLADRASRIARTLLYTVLAFVLGVLGFSLVLTLLALGAGTVVIWVGLPLLVTAVLVARLFAGTERGLQAVLLDSPLPAPRAAQAPAGAGAVRRMLTPLTDPQRWLDSLWVLVNFLLSALTFPILLTWTLGALATACGPLATMILERVLEDPGRSGLGELLGMSGSLALTVDIAMQIAIGLVFLLTLGPVARGLAALHRGVGRGLLSSRFEEQQHLLRTEESRAAGRSAESAALRRLERDLHDGPQQRLVRASMDLARAESLAQKDPERARTVLRETREQLGETLDELRRLSRGIAPPVLVDRGLPAALAELAAISPVPVTIEAPALDLPGHVEIGIYYVVSEALNNAAKHSGAGAATVELARIGEYVRVRIEDDGRGGAVMRAEGGLAGLAGRVASLEGRLEVRSPVGVGTRVEAVIPCAS